jgi:hypothetical protein
MKTKWLAESLTKKGGAHLSLTLSQSLKRRLQYFHQSPRLCPSLAFSQLHRLSPFIFD